MTIPPFRPEDLKAGPRLACLVNRIRTRGSGLVAMATLTVAKSAGDASGQASHPEWIPLGDESCAWPNPHSPHIQVSCRRRAPGGNIDHSRVSPIQLHSLLDAAFWLPVRQSHCAGTGIHSMLRTKRPRRDRLCNRPPLRFGFDQLDVFGASGSDQPCKEGRTLNRFWGLGCAGIPTSADMAGFCSSESVRTPIPQARITFCFTALPGQEDNRTDYRYADAKRLLAYSPHRSHTLGRSCERDGHALRRKPGLSARTAPSIRCRWYAKSWSMPSPTGITR